ncbi:hypothetical protein SASPL_143548 [Salvia splendens]|uniref:Uncharacterized protein n=1 Tax=Salvia splendens TaxID=180675 RepID=A0A8X8WP32_SALSN|nr:hypothetical protein SASPL_143548 [Salvia splendens]
MVERSSQLPEGVEDQIAPNDIFSQIMGKDKPGHVRMMGKGVCPIDVWSGTPRSTSDRLLIEYKYKIARLEAMLAAKQRPASQADIRPCVTNSESLSSQATTQADLVGTYVSLRSFLTQKVVAKGFIYSLNPTTRVGRIELV